MLYFVLKSFTTPTEGLEFRGGGDTPCCESGANTPFRTLRCCNHLALWLLERPNGLVGLKIRGMLWGYENLATHLLMENFCM